MNTNQEKEKALLHALLQGVSISTLQKNTGLQLKVFYKEKKAYAVKIIN